MLRKVTSNFRVAEGFDLLKSVDLLYLIPKNKTKIIAVFTQNADPREIMRACSQYLKEQRKAGLI